MPNRVKRIQQFIAQAGLFTKANDEFFVCPTCLKSIDPSPEDGQKTIDKAHISPRAAGGKATTLTCAACNQRFGRLQDAWLADYLKAERGDIFAGSRRKGLFYVNGLRVNGDFRAEPDSISFFLDPKRNHPSLIDQLQIKLRESPVRKFTVPVPMSTHMRLIHIGFLTAAYLAWFEAARYSWVFQNHLDLVRAQIETPEAEIIPRSFIQATNDERLRFATPVTGAIFFDDMILPAVVFVRSIIIFPSPEHPDPYSRLSPNMAGATMRFQCFQIPRFRSPTAFSVSYKNKMILYSDRIQEVSRENLVHLLFQGERPKPVILYPATAEETKELRKSGHTIIGVNLETEEFPVDEVSDEGTVGT